MTLITITGNLVADPELKFTPSGTAVANFTVAVNKREPDKATNEWKTVNTSFYRCNAWRGMAEAIAGELRKGQEVIILGEIQIREYEKTDGTKASSTEIAVKKIGPVIRVANSTTNATPPTPAPAATSASAWGATSGGPF